MRHKPQAGKVHTAGTVGTKQAHPWWREAEARRGRPAGWPGPLRRTCGTTATAERSESRRRSFMDTPLTCSGEIQDGTGGAERAQLSSLAQWHGM